jgi:hypothetical protein
MMNRGKTVRADWAAQPIVHHAALMVNESILGGSSIKVPGSKIMVQFAFQAPRDGDAFAGIALVFSRHAAAGGNFSPRHYELFGNKPSNHIAVKFKVHPKEIDDANIEEYSVKKGNLGELPQVLRSIPATSWAKIQLKLSPTALPRLEEYTLPFQGENPEIDGWYNRNGKIEGIASIQDIKNLRQWVIWIERKENTADSIVKFLASAREHPGGPDYGDEYVLPLPVHISATNLSTN